YAKDHNDDANLNKVLAKMHNITDREARFTCGIALVIGNDQYYVEGHLNGTITTMPKGHNGFGYDPIFYVAKYQLTLAQLSAQQKNMISHRACALKQLEKIIKEVTNAN
ncbi:MAG: non-canonical purine NTP pyrophosphatase, partial [Bacilli bacterium]